MKKLSEFRGAEALDVLADLIEPATEFMSDKEVVLLLRDRSTILSGASLILKKHPKAILRIMARLEGADPETYNPSLVALPKMLVELFNDPELIDLFTSQGQSEAQTNSGSATENIEVLPG